MNIITVVVTLVSALIGLVLGYFAISLKMKSAKETAELTLLNAEQEASNVRGRAEEQAEVILKTAERDRQTLKKELLLEAKEEARKYREEIAEEFKSERQELKQIESRLTERATSLDRKDDNLTNKEKKKLSETPKYQCF
ncbi:hypothetical protein LI88_01680 [Streptococcus suis]|nr:hypothetical protein LI88_01680 [Streptococcus suis]